MFLQVLNRSTEIWTPLFFFFFLNDVSIPEDGTVLLKVTFTDCLNLRDNIKVFKSVEGLNSWIETFRNNLSESALDQL